MDIHTRVRKYSDDMDNHRRLDERHTREDIFLVMRRVLENSKGNCPRFDHKDAKSRPIGTRHHWRWELEPITAVKSFASSSRSSS
jgi:hypothetical protein